MLYTSVWLQEKEDWREDLVYFVYWINKINKQMKYLAGWWGFVYLATSGCFDLVGRCCRVTLLGQPEIQLVRDLCLAYLYLPTSNTGSRKYYLWKKMIGWKISLFFITENFLGILDFYAQSLCAEAMIFSVWHWPSLGQHPIAVIFFYSVDICGSVFCVDICGSVFCVSLGVWRVKWVNQKRFDVFYYNSN